MTQREGDPTTLPVLALSLQGLSDDLDSLLESDRIFKLTNDAAARIAEVALSLIPEDLATRMPVLEQQWQDWSGGVIEPLREANQLDPEMEFTARINGDDGAVSSLTAELKLTPSDSPDALTVRTRELSDAKYLFGRFRPDAKVYRLSYGEQQLASNIGYPVLRASMGKIGPFSKRSEQYVVPQDIIQLATQRRLEVVR